MGISGCSSSEFLVSSEACWSAGCCQIFSMDVVHGLRCLPLKRLATCAGCSSSSSLLRLKGFRFPPNAHMDRTCSSECCLLRACHLCDLQKPPQYRTTSSALPTRSQSPHLSRSPSALTFRNVPHLDPASMIEYLPVSLSKVTVKCERDAMGSVMHKSGSIFRLEPRPNLVTAGERVMSLGLTNTAGWVESVSPRSRTGR
mmetsp:Transcript_133897/g.317444  ORF Transcript_133897/g.317444 Transcript_133897/m.317444 type:complete len:200 (-) Transcript_133897:1372-1971(-)